MSADLSTVRYLYRVARANKKQPNGSLPIRGKCVCSASRMSTSIAILKVLSAYPEGHASFASLNADLQMLASPEWFARMRALGIRAGAVNLFSDKLARRDASGWTITDAGRSLLARLESGERLAEGPAVRLVISADQTRADVPPDDTPALSLSLSA